MWTRRPVQILGLLLGLLGWGFVGCTLAMDKWRVAQLGGQGGSSVVATARYWSDLWRDCYEDSTALVHCVDFGVLWRVKPYIQATRGLLVIGLCLGSVGTVLTFLGLECTDIGGDRRGKDRMLVTASALHLLGGLSDVAAYCLYVSRVVAAFLHGTADPSKLRYEMGPPLYLGLVGSLLILLGCTVHCATAYRPNHPKRRPTVPSICERGGEKEALKGQKLPAGTRQISKGSRSVFPYKMASVVTV